MSAFFLFTYLYWAVNVEPLRDEASGLVWGSEGCCPLASSFEIGLNVRSAAALKNSTLLLDLLDLFASFLPQTRLITSFDRFGAPHI